MKHFLLVLALAALAVAPAQASTCYVGTYATVCPPGFGPPSYVYTPPQPVYMPPQRSCHLEPVCSPITGCRWVAVCQ
jgi:hypothetical protein